jgi:hypothetical protein
VHFARRVYTGDAAGATGTVTCTSTRPTAELLRRLGDEGQAPPAYGRVLELATSAESEPATAGSLSQDIISA